MKQHYPAFSVVIPTYNRAALILRTLESVWRQTYPHYEIIVVDNCSTDNTLEVLEPYVRAQRLRLIKHETNRERAQSRNTGMAAATGDYLTFLDSDDLMYPTNLEDAANYRSDHPESKCFHNLYEFVDDQGKLVYRPRFPAVENQIKGIASGNFMSCIGDFIHRDIYTHHRFSTDPEIIGGEDWDFWLRVLAIYKLGRIEKINSGVVQHEGRSVNHQDMASLEQGLKKIKQNICTDPELAGIYSPYLKFIESSSLMYLATLANAGQCYKPALSYLYRAARKNPGVLVTSRFIRTLQIAIQGIVGRQGGRLQDKAEPARAKPRT
ncbi:MAG TPA: glycosyltransferase family A protein [Pyrinomonadaceae bacterium]|nr:glycosyltransferase family A protein [Pyrinomonadaceae bacterium]